MNVSKALRKPSVVIVCKKSFKLLLLLGLVAVVILFLFLIFKSLAYFISNIGATFVIFPLKKTIAVYSVTLQAWQIPLHGFCIPRIILVLEIGNRVLILNVNVSEFELSRDGVTQLLNTVKQTRELMETMPVNHQIDRIDLSYLASTVQTLKKQMTLHLEIFSIIGDQKNWIQQVFDDELSKIKRVMGDVHIKIDGQDYELWTLEHHQQREQVDQGSKCKREA